MDALIYRHIGETGVVMTLTVPVERVGYYIRTYDFSVLVAEDEMRASDIEETFKADQLGWLGLNR